MDGRGDGKLVAVGDYLTLVGCAQQVGERDSATIAVPSAGGIARFNCANVEKDSIKAAVSRYREAVQASLGGSSVLSWNPDDEGGGTGAVYLFTSYHCEVTTYWNWAEIWGVMVVTGVSADCTFREYWWIPGVGGPNPPSAPPEPIVDTTATDRCRSAYRNQAGTIVVDSTCLRSMTQDEINQVRALVTDYRGVVNDPVLRAQCDEVFGWLTEELNKTAASLGTPASQTLYIANRNGPSDDPQKRIHSGDTFRGKSHVDPFFFQDVASNTGANRQNAERHLLAAFLHEVAHMYNKDHGEAETMAQYLSHDYFKAIESMVPGVACVRRS